MGSLSADISGGCGDQTPDSVTRMSPSVMNDQTLVDKWHVAIVTDCEKKLGRPLTQQEERFIVSRQGLMALEMIEDTARELTGADLEQYLNSEGAES